MRLILLSGYARAGKTSALKEITKEGWQVVSTSRYLTCATLEYFDQPVTDENIVLIENKDRVYNEYFTDMFGYSLRDAKIHVAEDVIVPSKGRKEGLVIPAIDNQLGASLNADSNIIAEVFNKEEAACFLSAFQQIRKANRWELQTYLVQLRRDSELTDVDKRELFGSVIQNDGTITEAVQKILKLVATLDQTPSF